MNTSKALRARDHEKAQYNKGLRGILDKSEPVLVFWEDLCEEERSDQARNQSSAPGQTCQPKRVGVASISRRERISYPVQVGGGVVQVHSELLIYRVGQGHILKREEIHIYANQEY